MNRIPLSCSNPSTFIKISMHKINWISISLINLSIVSILGVLMRYKICYSLTFLDQKFLLHAHSYFAFSGWVSQSLMVAIFSVMKKDILPDRIKKYHLILLLNLLCAYCMLFSFASFGHNLSSILFSFISLVIFAMYACMMNRDLKKCVKISRPWFYASLLFYLLSCAGTVSLSYITATKSFNQELYLSSVYWYLHFQYNGWFFFACTGLFLHWLAKNNALKSYSQTVFSLFAFSCIPAYGLSVLWLDLPPWIFAFVAIASIVQFFAWIKLVRMVDIKVMKEKINSFGLYLFILIALSFSIKFLLQLGSTIPAISKLAFGFRSIVIAYLHLVLLACISLFIVSYFYITNSFRISKSSHLGLTVFVVGIFLNELFLAIEGIASFSYTVIPRSNQILLGIALVMASGLLIFNISNNWHSRKIGKDQVRE